ncbi:MAG TPA: hypothetical protein PKV72_06570 [Candidatus Peribacteria bacterium]|nr:hypothetical protein [Candidatus Peribacteria bacterium]
MAYQNLDKLIGLMAGTEDPDSPANAEIVAELGDPASATNQLRDHIQLQTELLLAEPPDDLKFDVEHGLADAVTSTRRHMNRAVPELGGHTPRATAEDVSAMVHALRIPPDALRSKAARDAAVKASIANMRAQNPDSRIGEPGQFDAVVDTWLKAHVRSVDMILRRK